LTQYGNLMGALKSPAIAILYHQAMSTTGTDPSQSSPYAALRYGLTAALMNNGFYAVGPVGSYDNFIQPFDEYWVNSSGVGLASAWNGNASSIAAGVGYMGMPTSSWGSVSGSGAYSTQGNLKVRMYYNATTNQTWVAICSGPGNGSNTINATTLHAGSAGFKMINGSQSSVNNGTTVSSITIPSGYDGRIAQLL
jgi:hypothetical protein